MKRFGLFFTLAFAWLAACDSPSAPSTREPAISLDAGGNSDAAHACQQGGYLDLFRTDGTAFKNTGECVSYAAHGGTFVTRQTATLTNVMFFACNLLTVGYELDGVEHTLQTVQALCNDPAGAPGDDQTIHYLSNQTLRLFLYDNTCDYTFFEDGNHALVTGSNPYTVAITDAGGDCEAPPSVSRPPDPLGNLNLTETITPG